MELGEKIKAIRIARGLTQKELAGDTVTRNHLSLIESGTAEPSLSTLRTVADRLGVSAGYLLGDEDEEKIWNRPLTVSLIRRLYAEGKWTECAATCAKFDNNEEDPEICRILSECVFNNAKHCFGRGLLRESARMFREVCERCAKYRDGRLTLGEDLVFKTLSEISGMYLVCLSDISPGIAETNGRISLNPGVISDPFALYYYYYRPVDSRSAGLRPSEAMTEEYVSSRPGSEKMFTMHIRARLLMKRSEFRKAEQILTGLALSDSNVPYPVLLFYCSDLAICSKMLRDESNARLYSDIREELIDCFINDPG